LGDLFNSRQKLALITFTEKVRLAYKKMIEEGYDEDYPKAVVSYLGLLLGKLADWNCVLSVWRPDQERNEHVFNRQALPMIWDYGERNPFEGSLMDVNGNIISILSHLTQIPPVEVEENEDG
jgi:adenine-specific DNA methylase